MNSRFLTALVMACVVMIFAPSAGAQDDSLRQIQEAARATMSGTTATRGVSIGDIITGDITLVKNFAFGQVIGTAVEQGAPDFRLFMARRINGQWSIALEDSSDFYTWLERAPAALMPPKQREFLLKRHESQLRSLTRATARSGASRLGLPFATGETWVYTGGPHSNGGTSTPPLSSVDFAVDLRTNAGLVRAAREGYVVRAANCPNYVRIDHGDGWSTGYYHLINEAVSNGQYVSRGTVLGKISNGVGCGGWSSGPHVHFSVLRYASHVSISGMDVGGWTILAGNSAYYGTARRVRDGYTITQQMYMYNDGSIGSGYVDKRYDSDNNGVQDAWAVNMRNMLVQKTTVSIASGNNLTTLVRSNQISSLPIQPQYLNTSFGAADYNQDGVTDLWVVHRLDGSGKTAFRVMQGPDFYWLIGNEITALPAFSNFAAFVVDDYNRDSRPDLWAITPRDESNGNKPRVQIVNGANVSQILADKVISTVPLIGRYADVNYAAADYNLDGFTDLWMILPRYGKYTSVGVRVVSGRDWSTVLVDSGSALPMQSTNINEYGFMVADYNGDIYPDLWLINRISGAIKVVSGRNFQNVLYNGGSALANTHTNEFHIIGSDRPREMLWPAASAHLPIGTNGVVNTPAALLSFKPAGLAETYTVRLTDKSGVLVFETRFSDMLNYCPTTACGINTSRYIPTLRDNQIYRVDVITSNAYGSRTTSSTFTTDIPGIPTLTSPTANTAYSKGAGLVFTWAAQPNADNYILRVRRLDKTFLRRIDLTAAQCSAGVCSATLPDTLTAGSYEWWVAARNTSAGGSSVTVRVPFTVSATTPPLTTEPVLDPQDQALPNPSELVPLPELPTQDE